MGHVDVVHDGLDISPFVVMSAAQKHQHPTAGDGEAAYGTAVALDGRRREPRQIGQWNLTLGRADYVGGGPPTRAKNDRNVV